MKSLKGMKPTFEKTVDVLVKAYLNDTLQIKNCHACAVGNIVAASMGYFYKENKTDPEWGQSIIWSHRRGYHRSHDRNYKPTWYRWVKEGYESESAVEQVKSTGYSYEQLQLIEKTFEASYFGNDAMFNGLMAVVLVLADIHNVDLQTKESAQKLFVK